MMVVILVRCSVVSFAEPAAAPCRSSCLAPKQHQHPAAIPPPWWIIVVGFSWMSPLDSPQMFSFAAEIHNQRVYRQKVPKCFHDILYPNSEILTHGAQRCALSL